MPHVRVQRFGTGDRQHHGAHRKDAELAVVHEEHEGMMRNQCLQDAWLTHDAAHAKHTEGNEPGQGDGSKQGPDATGSVLLDRENAEQDENGDWRHVVGRGRAQHFDAFDRRQHRNGRRDHGVAKKQRRAEQADDHYDPAGPQPADATLGQRHQGHDAAFTLVVRAQDEGGVLDRHHRDQRPENQRQHAEHVFTQWFHAMLAKGFAKRIQRTGADVTEYNAYGQEAERKQPLVVGLFTGHGFAHDNSPPLSGNRTCSIALSSAWTSTRLPREAARSSGLTGGRCMVGMGLLLSEVRP